MEDVLLSDSSLSFCGNVFKRITAPAGFILPARLSSKFMTFDINESCVSPTVFKIGSILFVEVVTCDKIVGSARGSFSEATLIGAVEVLDDEAKRTGGTVGTGSGTGTGTGTVDSGADSAETVPLRGDWGRGTRGRESFVGDDVTELPAVVEVMIEVDARRIGVLTAASAFILGTFIHHING